MKFYGTRSQVTINPDGTVGISDTTYRGSAVVIVSTYKESVMIEDEPQLMREMLQYRKWIIASSCTQLIQTLPLMSRDDKKVEDCVKFESGSGQVGDDAADCARYGLKSRMGDAPVPHDIQLKASLDRVAAATPGLPRGDVITNQHIAHLKFEHKFRQANRPWRRPARGFARA